MTDLVSEALCSAQVAAMIGVKPHTLAVWRVQGKGPRFCKLSRVKQAGVVYRRSDVEAWMQERTVASTSEYSAGAR